VLDTYNSEDWERVASTPHRRLVAFSDALPDKTTADVVVIPEADTTPREPALALAGLRFTCLRKAFWALPPRVIREHAGVILVTTGGTLGDLATRIATRIATHFPALAIELVWGPGFDGERPSGVTLLEHPRSLIEPLLRADLVVCGGGQTMLEAAATGAPAVVLEAADNQRRQIAALTAQDAILTANEEGLPAAVEHLLGSAALRRELSNRARMAVDGRGALRVADELLRTLN
jgi:spore coat polysaccharide biosynthesis predicted glycosyltransferase SpsG